MKYAALALLLSALGGCVVAPAGYSPAVGVAAPAVYVGAPAVVVGPAYYPRYHYHRYYRY